MPSACGSRSCLCQSVYPCGELLPGPQGRISSARSPLQPSAPWGATTRRAVRRGDLWSPAHRGCPSRGGPARPGPPFLPEEMGGKKGPGVFPRRPPKRGLMAAVGCTGRAKTGRALPPALSALTSQALPRLGRHASGLPCKPRKLLRCTGLARRAAVGAMPLKYHGGRGNCPWGATTRRALGGSPADRRPQVAPTGDQSLTLTNRGRMISAPTGTTVTAPGRAGHSAELHAALHTHGLDAGQGRPKAARRFGNPTSFSRWGN